MLNLGDLLNWNFSEMGWAGKRFWLDEHMLLNAQILESFIVFINLDPSNIGLELDNTRKICLYIDY